MDAPVKTPEQRLLLMLLADNTGCDGLGIMNRAKLRSLACMSDKAIRETLDGLKALVTLEGLSKSKIVVSFSCSEEIRLDCGFTGTVADSIQEALR